MPYMLDDLEVDRIDFVCEGADSAAFIKIFKRKEAVTMEYSEILSKMKPEHAEVISQTVEGVNEELSKARSDLEEANATISEQAAKIAEVEGDLAKARTELEELKTGAPTEPTEEDVLKSMPEGIREEYLKMRAQRDAAEEQVRKAADEKAEAEAVAKAATLKSLPVEQETLVRIIKGCDPAVLDVLSAAAAAIDSTVLTEVGKSRHSDGGSIDVSTDAWAKIEAEAEKIATRDGVTKAKAITLAVKENPDLYKEYLNGGVK